MNDIQEFILPDQSLLAAGEEMAMSIMASLDDARSRDRENWDHSENNWASEIHHPCAKHLVHCRVDWKEGKLPDVHSLYRFEEGIDQEWLIKEKLARIGSEMDKSQRSVKIPEYKISGKIDGTMPKPPHVELPEIYNSLRKFPTEIKTLNPHFWESTKTVKDIKAHKKFWINKMCSQLNVYLFGMKIPLGFLILKTFGKRWRILPMLFDQDLLDADFAMARKVNEHVDAGTYPEPIPYDPTVCGMCKFEHLCQPLSATMMTEITEASGAELGLFCELQEQFKGIKKHYEDWKAELVGSEKTPGRFFGQDGMIYDITIKTSVQNRKRIREDKKEEFKKVKEPYEEPYELRITSIDRIAP